MMPQILRTWRERRLAKRRRRDFAEGAAAALETSWHGIAPMQPPADPEVLQLLSDEALHGWLGRFDLNPDTKIGMERELRRREAWAAPAGRAVKVSAWALLVSVLALGVSAVAVWLNSN